MFNILIKNKINIIFYLIAFHLSSMLKFMVSAISAKSMSFNEFYWVLHKISRFTASTHFCLLVNIFLLYIFFYKIVMKIFIKNKLLL